MKNVLFLFILLNFSIGFSQTESPEKIVQIQLEAYNNRNIDAFLATYDDNIKIYDFPNTLSYEGKEKMRKIYSSLFKEVPNLLCEIKKRIIIGNKVIDEEYVRVNNEFVSAVAIYEVKNNKIIKVTFIH
ncbi:MULTISPECIES: nuclear transport factor 2 family protein [Flavobacterium]|uniref:Nuclear transport factor 2 family protein n=1 Tax=Flavobacterium jumunjinense TaxID=998845 RepID=A0ABV5GSW1_9FLAO|nr:MULTISPECIES: nuclear transport factor 2 family protein [Flavobacterium]